MQQPKQRTPQSQKRKTSITGKKVAAFIGIIAAIITIIAGGIAIWQAIHPNGPDTFEGDVTQASTANSLISFLQSHDGKVIRLDITCVSPGPSTACDVSSSSNDSNPILPLPVGGDGSSAAYWLHLDPAGTNVEMDNGSYGAGSLVIRGYFEVSVRGVLGSDPPNVQNVFLTGVNSSAVH